MNEDLATNYGGKTRLAGTQVRSVVYAGYCQVQLLIEDSQLGWYGQVSDKGWSYQQDIVLTNIGKTLKLRRTPEEGMSVSDQLTDKIDNVARVTLLGFSQWTNAPLRTSGIFAFNGKNEWTSSFPTGVWNPFTEIGDVSGYQNNLNTLKTYFSGAETSILSGTKLDDANRIKNEVNREADMVKGLGSGTITPQAWVGTIDGMPRTVGNDIIAKMRKTVLLARIQMLFSGDDFGLYIPTGKPQIVSSDATIRFPEVGSGYLNVKVKNIGEAMGTFLLKGACGSQIQVEEEEFSLDKGLTKDFQLRHTGKSTILAPTQSFSCTLELKETNTQEKVTKAYGVTLEVKQQCTEGEETDPRMMGSSMVVYVLDSFCQTKSTKSCPLVGYEFVKQNGLWVCKAKGTPPVEQCKNGIKDGDETGIDCGGSCGSCGGDKQPNV